jgi:hypothetical protein
MTAARLRLDAGESMEQVRAFLGRREPPEMTRYRLARLPQLPEDAPRADEDEGPAPELPRRNYSPFHGDEAFKHGFFARRQPPDEVLAVLGEAIHGVDEEIAGLREIGQGLFRMQSQNRSRREAARLANAYTLTAERLAGLIGAERKPSRNAELHAWAEEVLARFGSLMEEEEEPPPGTPGQADTPTLTPTLGEDEGMGMSVVEEVAAARCVLRRTLALAREAGIEGQVDEYIHLADYYGMGCRRLVHLLRLEDAGQDEKVAYVQRSIQTALEQVYEEWDL